MTGTVKVYEIAEDLKLDTETVLQKIQALGIPAKNKMSKIDAAYVDHIKSSLAKDRQASFVEVEVAPGVRKLKRVEPPPAPPKPAPRPVIAHTPEVARPVVARVVEPVVEAPPAPVAKPVTPVAPVVEKAPEPAVAKAPEPAVEKAPEPAAERAPEKAPEPVVVRAPEPAASASEKAPEPVAAKAPEKAPESAPKAPEKAPEPAVVKAAEKAPEPAAEKTPEPAVVKAPEPAPEPVAVKAPEPAPKAPEKAPEPVVVKAPEKAPEPTAEKAPEKTPEPVVVKAPEPAPKAPEKAPEPAVVKAPEPAPVKPAPRPVEEPRVSAAPSQPEAAALSAQPPRPSQPPPGPAVAKRGIEVWDPVTRTVKHVVSDQPSGPRTTMSAPSTAPKVGPGARPPRVTTVFPAPQAGGRRPGPGQRPGPGAAPGAKPGMRTQPFGARTTQGPATPSTQDPKRKPVIKIEQQISLQELARRMNLKATEVLMKLLQLGGGGKNINSTLDADTATLLAGEFGFTVEDVALDTEAIIKKALAPDQAQDNSPRPPVVTVMGHVDHGKTTLLDAVLGMRVAEGEAGGITQEVRAYRVQTPKGPVVFFDTPGHEAFTALRMRGAQTTDVAVLVVAADDGVMPTTVEAINHAKAAKVPIVVALNKMDKPDANPTRVLEQLLQYDVITEQFGGTTLAVRVSAKTRQGIEELLENLALQTEILDLKANAKKSGVGTVFESKLDKGRGAVARVLVQEGIIRNGDIVLAASGAYGRIRAMFDDRGKAIDKAGPSTPIEILGLSEPPTAGDKIYVCADARKAQEAAEQLKLASKKPAAAGHDVFDVTKYLSQSETITVNVVVKADAQGAVEGLKKALTELSTEKVKVVVLHAAVGAITESDVQLAVPSRAVIIGFNVRPAGKAAAMAEDQKVTMRFYNVIYEAVDDIKALMVGQLKPTLVEKAQGKAEIRQVFNITKVGIIAGCMVTEGSIKRGALVRLVRDSAVKWEGKIGSVRRIKDDVKEVTQGFECGIGLENTPDLKPGDVLEAYELEEVAAQL